MNAGDLQRALVECTLRHSRYEANRGYLRMSRISKCPRRLFFEIRDGVPASKAHELKCYKGYQMEADLLNRLSVVLSMDGFDAELFAGEEEISAFGGRLLGHPDGELVLGGGERVLLEIKSTVQENLSRIMARRRVPTHHWLQVQCYMHFGDWGRAFVIYEARDTGAIYVHEVGYERRVGEQCERKAKLVLDALEAGEPPECLCGRCS